MANVFYFGTISSAAAGLIIEKRPRPTIPERRKTIYRVAGRNDDIYEDEGCYNNIDISYEVGCSDIDSNMNMIKTLCGQVGYNVLTDSWMGDYYRRAYIKNPIEFSEDLVSFGHATITFSADPYRYNNFNSINGWVRIGSSSSPTTLTNPNGTTALPYIRANGTPGQIINLNIENRIYKFSIPSTKKIYIDCMNETADDGSANACRLLDFDSFPYLDAKSKVECSFSYTGLTSPTVEILPMWRKI